MPEYMIERDEAGNAIKAIDDAGAWTENFYDLPLLAGEVLVKFLDDAISPELYSRMANIAAKYSQETSQKELTEIYQGLIDQRIALFNNAIQPQPQAVIPEISTTEPPVVEEK